MLFDANVTSGVEAVSISVGSGTIIESAVAESNPVYSGGLRIITLSASTFIYVWQSQNNSTLRMAVVPVSGGAIGSIGIVVTSSNYTSGLEFDAKVISSTKFIVAHRSASTTLSIETYTVSGTTITLDATTTTSVNSASEGSGAVHVLSSTRAIVMYASTSNTTDYKVRGMTLGSGTLTLDSGSTTLTVGGTTDALSVPASVSISSTELFMFYGYDGTPDMYYSKITDNGSAVAPTVTTATFAFRPGDGTQASYRTTAIKSGTTIAVFLGNEYNGGGYNIGTYSGSVITWGITSGLNNVTTPYSIGGAIYKSGIATEFKVLAISNNVDTSTVGLYVVAFDTTNLRPRYERIVPVSSKTNSTGSPCDISEISSTSYIIGYLNSSDYPVAAIVTTL